MGRSNNNNNSQVSEFEDQCCNMENTVNHIDAAIKSNRFDNMTEQVEAATNNDDLQSEDHNDNNPVNIDAFKKKKKRKARLGKTRRAATGFEEFYADSPITPAEHQENMELYSTEKSFVERIEQAVQRYRQKRRFDSQRSFLFDKYLALGGIESSQRMFQGLDPEDTKIMTNDEIRTLTARDVIQRGFGGSKFYDPNDPGEWTVDFPSIVKGFLSRWVVENYPRSEEGYNYDNQQAANLVFNFLNYLQFHDVCPEYNSQLLAAKAVCANAPTELGCVRELFEQLCDPFNTAAKFLFCDGGVFEISKDSPINGTDEAVKLDPFLQLIIFRLTIMDVTKNTEHIAVNGDPCSIRIESTATETYQVVSVNRRKRREKIMLEGLLADQGLGGKIKPAGTMFLRPNMIEHAYSNMPRPEEVDWTEEQGVRFIVDDEVLGKVQPGMKMELEVCKLNIDVVFIKKVLDVRPTFDTLLPQSLMLTWKEPTANERPAPSVDNPDLEEKINCDEDGDSK